ncbi:MAG: HigA family addiction module antidote protein [Prevotellaceae bacterium]|jgi:addiction module HigA family antidote|nr:HigA family addiction module antidote protein [Prevotellaceae bacterium]
MAANMKFGFTPTHPGEVLKDEIEYRKLSQSRLAKQMGMSYKVLNDILNERRPLTTATAMMFEAALGIPAYSLIHIQTEYNMQVASRDKSLLDRLAQIRKMAAIL